MPRIILEKPIIVLLADVDCKAPFQGAFLYMRGGEKMIRIIGTRLIMPRGDTTIFTLPSRGYNDEGDIAMFCVKDTLTHNTVVKKIADASQDFLVFELEHKDTCELEAKKYNWDITIYRKPEYDIETGEVVGAMEVESYYAAMKKPVFHLVDSANDV